MLLRMRLSLEHCQQLTGGWHATELDTHATYLLYTIRSPFEKAELLAMDYTKLFLLPFLQETDRESEYIRVILCNVV